MNTVSFIVDQNLFWTIGKGDGKDLGGAGVGVGGEREYCGN